MRITIAMLQRENAQLKAKMADQRNMLAGLEHQLNGAYGAIDRFQGSDNYKRFKNKAEKVCSFDMEPEPLPTAARYAPKGMPSHLL